jgi:hypothetical protein
MALVNKQTETRVPKRRIQWDRVIQEAVDDGPGQYTISGKERVAEHQARRAANTLQDKFNVSAWIERDDPALNAWTAWFEIKPNDVERLKALQAEPTSPE